MLKIASVTVDAHDPARLAQFWGDLLGWPVASDDDGDDEVWITGPDGTELLFVASSDVKQVKNRMHLDLRPDDQSAAVERALALGATRADIGQTGSESWVVLADPEGNEFCILRANPQDSA